MDIEDSPNLTGKNRPKSLVRVLAREREQKALEGRLAGKTFQQIGDELGITPQAVSAALGRALEQTKKEIAEKADELRATEAERLREMFNVLRPMVQDGDMRAADRYLRVSESFRKLTGIDLRPAADEGQAPTLIEVRFPWDTPGEVVEGTAEDMPGIGPGDGE